MRELLHFLRWGAGIDKITPWMAPQETDCLVRHAAGKRRLAEIGVWEGGSTRIIRQAMAPEAVLFGIDPHPSGRLGVSYARMIAAGRAWWYRGAARQRQSGCEGVGRWQRRLFNPCHRPGYEVRAGRNRRNAESAVPYRRVDSLT